MEFLCFSLFSLWVATLPGTCNLSFGYHRAEILSALISVVAIWILTVLLMIEAYKRLSDPSPVNGSIMFVTVSCIFLYSPCEFIGYYVRPLHVGILRNIS
jgi:Co/Zn/Cd efflux system component